MIKSATLEFIPNPELLESSGIIMLDEESFYSIEKPSQTISLTNCIYSNSNLLNTDTINAGIENDIRGLRNGGFNFLLRIVLNGDGRLTYTVK